MMGKLAINLLPQEIILLQRQGAKIALINKISITSLLLLLLLMVGIFAVRLSQNNKLSQLNIRLNQESEEIGAFKEKESQLTILKSRLESIQELSATSKKTAAFNTILKLIPTDAKITLIAVEKSGTITILANATSIDSFDSLALALADKEKNSNLVNKLDLENFSIGKDGVIRFGLKVSPLQ